MTLFVIGTLVVVGSMALSANSIDGKVFRVGVGDCGAADGSRVAKIVDCFNPAANTMIVAWRYWDQGKLKRCPSWTTPYASDPTSGLGCRATF